VRVKQLSNKKEKLKALHACAVEFWFIYTQSKDIHLCAGGTSFSAQWVPDWHPQARSTLLSGVI
jgi:hypothetical protein